MNGEAPSGDADTTPEVRLRLLRASLGLSQEQLARRLGVSFATVNRWEAGRTKMSARASLALARFEAEIAASASEAGRVAAPEPGTAPEPIAVPHTSFVGREDELAELSALLGSARFISFIGPGGAGKTRLAIEAVRRCVPAEEVVFIPLEPVRHPQSLISTVASRLRVRDQPGVRIGGSVEAVLDAEPRLIVLDGAEHVRDEVADLVSRLLAAVPGQRIIVTSRVVLGALGEVCWTVPPLACPSAAAGVADIASSDAVQLFMARAENGCPASAAPTSPRTLWPSCAAGLTACRSRSS